MKIVVSGLSGCGATTVSRLVGKKLGIKTINYTFKNISREEGIELEKIQKNALMNKTDFILDSNIMKIAKGNFILASRLACWLSDYNLSVWLEAGVETRAKRIAERENKKFKEILHETIERDKENSERYEKIYGIDVSNHTFVDLIINVERFDALKTAEIISKSAKGMKLKRNSFSRLIKSRIKNLKF
ncbi:MAG: cytidylate kinase family protein [Candidatus Marsarchaeota archaeon]|nr:cytidylate kinase family protein [Candidatus Marsarchaeota archaeon]